MADAPQQNSKIEIPDPRLDAMKIFNDQVSKIREGNNILVVFVLGVMLIGFLTLLFALGGMMMDSWRYSSSAWIDQQHNQQSQQNLQDILTSLQTIQKELKK